MGNGGKEKTELFEKGLSLFNSNLKKLIKQYALVDLEKRHKGEWNNVIKNQFLNARKVKFKNDIFIAPIWELVNHEVKSLPFIVKILRLKDFLVLLNKNKYIVCQNDLA